MVMSNWWLNLRRKGPYEEDVDALAKFLGKIGTTTVWTKAVAF